MRDYRVRVDAPTESHSVTYHVHAKSNITAKRLAADRFTQQRRRAGKPWRDLALKLSVLASMPSTETTESCRSRKTRATKGDLS